MEAFFANLPYVLLILICPLMMLFMGHGRGHDDVHAHHHTEAGADPAVRAPTPKDEITTPPVP